MTVICLLPDAVGILKQQKQGKLELDGCSLKAVILDTRVQNDPEYHGSHAIRVANIPSGTNKDMLERFFKIRRRSGGGELEEVFYNSEDDVAMVTFSRADSKLSQRHSPTQPTAFNMKIRGPGALTLCLTFCQMKLIYLCG